MKSILVKLIRLIKNPNGEFKNLIKMLRRNTKLIFFHVFEFLNIDYLSRPYPNHAILLKNLNYKKNGFFVECGGYDGQFQDPTYNLEKFKGWTGIIIEPLPHMYELCKKNRQKSDVYNYIACSKDLENKKISILDVGPMYIIKNNELNYEEWAAGAESILGIKRKEIIVSTLTLDSIIENSFKKNKRRLIDLLVIDVEGYETEVLKGFSVNKYLPNFILILSGSMYWSYRQLLGIQKYLKENSVL